MYRYDDFYSNNINVKLTKDYMLLFDQDNTIAKKAYNSSEVTNIPSFNSITIETVSFSSSL